MSKGWNDNMLKKLKELVGRGLSTAEIGKKLGVSKNAVVGKLHRTGLNEENKQTKEATSRVKTIKTKEVKKVKEPTTAKTVKKAKAVTKVKTVSVEKKEKPLKTVEKKVEVKKAKAEKSTKTPIKEKKNVVSVKTASKKSDKELLLHQLDIEHALQMAKLKPNQCRWPVGNPDSKDFHFCGETVFTGKPYCYEHCRMAYQFTAPKKK